MTSYKVTVTEDNRIINVTEENQSVAITEQVTTVKIQDGLGASFTGGIYLLLNGSSPMEGDLNMDNFDITNVGTMFGDVFFDNTDTGLSANTVQEAIEELDIKSGSLVAFSRNLPVPSAGILYLHHGGVSTASAPPLQEKDTLIKSISIKVDSLDNARDYTVRVHDGTSVVYSLPLPANSSSAFDVAVDATIVAGRCIAVYMEKTSGVGKSSFNEIQVQLQVSRGT